MLLQLYSLKKNRPKNAEKPGSLGFTYKGAKRKHDCKRYN